MTTAVTAGLLSKIERDFEKFDRETPQIWMLFCRFAQRAIDAGQKRLGAKAIWERLRWELAVETSSRDGLKLNNNHVAYFARKWQSEFPHMAHFFETRKVKSDAWRPNGT